jgi:AmmeMemoRadiSam system protein B
LFGNVPLVAALIPDPLMPMIEEDGQRIAADQFVDATRDVLADVGGTSLFVASSDLSHVGLQFGEPRPVDDQRRLDVERHDRDMLANFLANDVETFMSGFAWNKNPTRWCSIGSMFAILQLARPEAIELIDYRQAYDDRGLALVSSAAIALLQESH